MALIKCEDCGKEISDKATACIHCGCPVVATVDVASENAEDFYFDELFAKYGKNKIAAIKEYREFANVSLHEGKDTIDREFAKRNTSGTSFLEKANEQTRKKQEEKQYEKERIAQLRRDKIPFCPKCKSTSLSANKKGFGIIKSGLSAVALGAATGGVGAVIGLGAGNIGAKKIRVTCLNCGKQFWAGK